MIYESTGEVRPPRAGDYYLVYDPNRPSERLVMQESGHDRISDRVIMRPIHTDHLTMLTPQPAEYQLTEAEATTGSIGEQEVEK